MGLADVPSLPAGIVLRARTDDDVGGLVAFLNRHAPPTEVESAAAFRRWHALNPMPTALETVAIDPAGAIVAVASVGDGGIWARADRSWRLNVVVDRAQRRRGIGRALAARLEAHARANGARRLNGSVRGDEPEALAFAAELGFAEYHRRYNSYLDVSAFDPAPFGDPQAVAVRAGVRFVTLAEALAAHAGDRDGFLRRLYDAHASYMADVPLPDPFTPPPFEAAKRMFFESPTLAHDATVLALRGDDVVGLTFTDVNEAGIAYTFMTGVARTERGKGVALALKLLAIAALKVRGVRWFGTTNDEANAPMRGINRRLGYATDAPRIQVRKELT